MTDYYVSALIEHHKSIFEIEEIIKKKQLLKNLTDFIQEFVGHTPEYYDYSWNTEDADLDDKGFLVPEFVLGDATIEMECPAGYIYIRSTILQFNFDISWDSYLKNNKDFHTKIDQIVLEIVNLFSANEAILLPTSQGQDYPSSRLKAGLVLFDLTKMKTLSDFYQYFKTNGILPDHEPKNSEDTFFILKT